MFNMDKTSKSKIIFVGVGPGDPNLITLSAIKAIESASVLTFPVAKQNLESRALKVAKQWINKNHKLISLYFPMTKNIKVCEEAWEESLNQLEKYFLRDEKVCFLCLGDVSIYSKAAYIMQKIEKKHKKIKYQVIPGVTSFSAAAALWKIPLAIRENDLLITECPDKDSQIKSIIYESKMKKRNIVLLKVGKRWPLLREILIESELLSKALISEEIGSFMEKLLKASQMPVRELSYFSLIIIHWD